jgi:DNA polymerase I-like protein with 3'-5' exonuclease and polymerase domains|nr:MAG TPA: DNA POLYMERASE [Caudoviricetes sp.]DAV87763.1 MAG TPA: DNA POLYMERASE [Caudoviricetes sp.]
MLTIKDKFIVFDIETDGLLDTTKRFWCGWLYDSYTDLYTGYTDLDEFFDALNKYGTSGYNIVGHNICKFDIPALKKLKGERFEFDVRDVCIDTLVLARLIYSNIKDTDVGLMRSGRLPKALYGSHSLKAYGYRMGELKGTYGEHEGAWDKFTHEMYEYNKQDVVVTLKLFQKLMAKGYPLKAIQLEHDIAWVMAKQERNGFVFDKDQATKLYSELAGKRQVLYENLVSKGGSWTVYKGDKIYKRDNAKRGIKAGVPYPQYEEVTFNPNSRQHIAKVLMDRGWEPTEMTPTGAPKVDEETLKTAKGIDLTEDILEYLLINKRIAQLAEGDNAWLKLMKDDPDGYTRIHGSVNPNGAVTGRATHAYPNVAQVPAGRSPYGEECRSLFRVPTGWYEAGIDASGLELRCFAHFLYPYDHGEYVNEILNGDIHTHNQKMAGLPTRDQAKTMIYCMMYGGGDGKLGEVINGTAKDGKALKERFFNAVPAYKELCSDIERTLITASEWVGGVNKVTWRKRVHPDNSNLSITHSILGLDRRVVYVRSPHSALNTLLQSAGALICKKWVCLVEENMRKAGYKHGWDGDFAMMAWVHDETQIACRTREIAEDCVRIAQESMRQTQEFFKFNCQLDTEGKIGANWFDCH